MIDMEGTHDNDDEPLSFISLAALTANLVRYLGTDKQNDENTGKKRDPGDGPKDRVPDNAADIERRVADILAMENRLRRKRI
jgi:hypothetical protein